MPTPLKSNALEILLQRALCSGVRSLKEELQKLDHLDPKEPNYKLKLEMRLKILRLLGELSGDIEPGKSKKKGRQKVEESGESFNENLELSEDEIAARKRRLSENKKKLDRTGAK